ncbi:MAG: hydroxymethylbilane synthase [Gammaproteobacteria bacterium]|nr:hydroxymethylbilane synthase [Gammaproteobacteria bacterium]
MTKLIRIGTRQSQLALWQADYVRDAILQYHPDRQIELVKILSEGDRTLDVPLSQVGGKGLFLKELEHALVNGEIDLAVHSMKDVTVMLPDGLHIPVFCPREDPRDAFVSNRYSSLSDMPDDAVVGTCSLRRQSQIKAAYPHLTLKNLRGNVNTRLKRLDEGGYDAIILAVSGLKRLGFHDRITNEIDTEICLPAVGQGIVGIECRIDDQSMNDLLKPLNCAKSTIRISAERAANERLGGGCHVPIAVYSEIQSGVQGNEDQLFVRGLVGELDGSRILRSEVIGPIEMSRELGHRIAEDLLSQGAGEVLQSVYQQDG